MKILTNNVLKNYTELRSHAKENHVSSPLAEGGHNYDAITIQSNPRQIEEHAFAKVLRQEITSDIYKTGSEEKIQNLKKQVASHTYQIDTHAIASRILLVEEGA